jgi:hypothetical protein
MKTLINSALKAIMEFLAQKTKRRLLLIGILVIIALSEFLILGLARRTFVFYTVSDGDIVVEDRMIKRSPSREIDITRYIEETLLGPVAPDLLPLFPRGTKLRSMLYRDGAVYADLSADAVLPPEEGGRTLDNFQTLYDGILRNFSFVKDIRFFIEGRTVYVDKFQQGGGEFEIFPEI